VLQVFSKQRDPPFGGNVQLASKLLSILSHATVIPFAAAIEAQVSVDPIRTVLPAHGFAGGAGEAPGLNIP
jgi:hypothetical protein